MQVWQALKSAVGETASVESVSSRTHWKRHCGLRPAPLDVVAFLGRMPGNPPERGGVRVPDALFVVFARA